MPLPSRHTNSGGGFRAVVIGGSAGSTVVIQKILSQLPGDFPAPIFIVQHLHESDEGGFAEHLAHTCRLNVHVSCDKQPARGGSVFVAPANYHMLLERQGTIALSVDAKVNYSRPSIDVLFESAAHAYGTGLIAVLLSGANDDGASGMKTVRSCGGLVVVQSPETAESPVMPRAAIQAANPHYTKPPADIAALLVQLVVASKGERVSHV